MLDKSNNNGFTKGLVVVVVAMEGAVEELELGAEAINGGSDTMKRDIRKGKMWRTKKREKQGKEKRKKIQWTKFWVLDWLIHWVQYKYITNSV